MASSAVKPYSVMLVSSGRSPLTEKVRSSVTGDLSISRMTVCTVVVSSIAVALNEGRASCPRPTVSPQPAPTSASASPITPVSSAASGGDLDPIGGGGFLFGGRRRVAFEIVLPGDRHQHLVRALVGLFFGRCRGCGLIGCDCRIRGGQRIDAGALRLEEGEILGAGRQRHDAHAGREHRVGQHLQRVRNGGLLHLVGDVEILEPWCSFPLTSQAG